MPTLSMDHHNPDIVTQRVRRFLRARDLPQGAALLAAVSGGADSLAMLYALAALRQEFGYTLRVGILHHGMRAEADAEVASLQRICDAQDAPLEVGRADVPALAARRRLSLEVAGREARYAFLYDAAARAGAHAVCTGHTLDDQAETVLLRVISGTGLEGLGGIAPERRALPPESRAPVWLWRPILDVTRAETVACCAARGQTVVEDPTNADPRYPRNRIRRDLMPLLARDYNPAVREALARLADLARAEEEFLADAAEEAAPVHPLEGGGAWLAVADVQPLPVALRRRVARRFLRATGATGRALGFANVQRLLDALEQERARLHLDGALELVVRKGRATLTPLPRP